MLFRKAPKRARTAREDAAELLTAGISLRRQAAEQRRLHRRLSLWLFAVPVCLAGAPLSFAAYEALDGMGDPTAALVARVFVLIAVALPLALVPLTLLVVQDGQAFAALARRRRHLEGLMRRYDRWSALLRDAGPEALAVRPIRGRVTMAVASTAAIAVLLWAGVLTGSEVDGAARAADGARPSVAADPCGDAKPCPVPAGRDI